MNINQAYQELGLSSSATPDEVKAKFRELSKQYHPDNKKTGDEEKFKKINEAQRIINNPPPVQEPFESYSSGGFNFDFGDFPFNPFGGGFKNQKQRITSEIHLKTTISFEDSILGCKQHFSFPRIVKCDSCQGNGNSIINNGCAPCKGSGRVIKQSGGTIMVQTCPTCKGKVSTKSCEKCNGDGDIKTDYSVDVHIPGGVSSGNILRLNGRGNFVGSFGNIDQYTNAFLEITVQPHANLRLEENTVVYDLSISLLEALEGVEKIVPTVLGDKNIDIPSLSKNKDEVILTGVGIERKGNQKIILNINYPDNIKDLIDVLRK